MTQKDTPFENDHVERWKCRWAHKSLNSLAGALSVMKQLVGFFTGFFLPESFFINKLNAFQAEFNYSTRLKLISNSQCMLSFNLLSLRNDICISLNIRFSFHCLFCSHTLKSNANLMLSLNRWKHPTFALMARMGASPLGTLQPQTARVESKVGLNQSHSSWNIIYNIYSQLWLEKNV